MMLAEVAAHGYLACAGLGREPDTGRPGPAPPPHRDALPCNP